MTINDTSTCQLDSDTVESAIAMFMAVPPVIQICQNHFLAGTIHLKNASLEQLAMIPLDDEDHERMIAEMTGGHQLSTPY